MKQPLTLLSAAALVTIGCSGSSLTPERAANRIAALDEFKRDAHFTLQVGTPFQSAFKCYEQAEVASMLVNRFVVDRGWARYERRDGNFGFGARGSCPTLALTAAGKDASARWRQGRGNGEVWTVPVGERELVAVTRLTAVPDSDSSMRVEFDWKWAPNETGVALRQSLATAKTLFETIRKGRASCRRVNDDWHCRLAMWTTAADATGELPR